MADAARQAARNLGVHLLFAVAASLLLLAGNQLYDATVQREDAARSADQSREVLQLISTLRESFALVEAAQRGYLISGREEYLAQRSRAAARVFEALDALSVHAHAADSESMQKNIDALRQAAHTRLRIAQQNAENRDRHDPSQPWPNAAESRRASAIVYEIAEQMHARQVEQLATRELQEDTRRSNAFAMLTGAFLVGLFTLVPVYVAAVREARQRQRSERQLADLVETLPVVAWQILTAPDGTRRFAYVGPGVVEARGLDPDAVRRDIAVVLGSIVDEDRPAVLAAMAQAERSLEPFDEVYRANGPGGRTLWIHSRANLRRTREGATLWTGYWADITRQKQLELALSEANEELEAFSYTVSHDLRAPVAAIAGFADALLERGAGHPRASHYLTRIRASATHMDGLIEGLLALARVTRTELLLAQVDLGTLAAEAAADLRAAEPDRHVELRIEPGMLVHGDVRLLRQLMVNLLSNAWKFSAPKPQAVVEVGRGAEPGVFYVRDNGVGFDTQAAAGRLFGVFERMHKAEEFEGTGVGLATVRRVAKRHGGDAWAESVPGESTTVWFRLALRPDEPARSTIASTRAAG